MFQTHHALPGIFPGRVAALCRQTAIVVVGFLLDGLAMLALLLLARPSHGAPLST